MKYVDPKNDLIFYKIFGKHPHILLSFLNSVMPITVPIVQIEYVEDVLSVSPTVSDALLKVYCVNQNKYQFAVEIQIDWLQMFSRVVDETKVYHQTFRPKKNYTLPMQTYVLHLRTQNFDKSANFHHHYKEVYVDGQRLENFEFVVIELAKFRHINNTQNKMMTQWLQFFNLTHGFYDIAPDLLANKEIKEATDLMSFGMLSPAEDRAYDRYWDNIRTLKSRESDRIEEEIEIGRKIGKDIGRQKVKIETAKNSIDLGLSDSVIASITGLDLDTIRQIRTDKQR